MKKTTLAIALLLASTAVSSANDACRILPTLENHGLANCLPFQSIAVVSNQFKALTSTQMQIKIDACLPKFNSNIASFETSE